MFIAIAKLFWAFEFSPKRDGRGVAMAVDTDAKTDYEEGFLHCPKAFEVDVRVRSERRRATIMGEFERARREAFSKYESFDEEGRGEKE